MNWPDNFRTKSPLCHLYPSAEGRNALAHPSEPSYNQGGKLVGATRPMNYETARWF